ncbi:MAG: hypothetical protein U0V73_14480 [Acidimicrobiia bacterium]
MLSVPTNQLWAAIEHGPRETPDSLSTNGWVVAAADRCDDFGAVLLVSLDPGGPLYLDLRIAARKCGSWSEISAAGTRVVEHNLEMPWRPYFRPGGLELWTAITGGVTVLEEGTECALDARGGFASRSVVNISLVRGAQVRTVRPQPLLNAFVALSVTRETSLMQPELVPHSGRPRSK